MLEGFRWEEANGTPTGGGVIDYQAESRGLYLSRTYVPAPDAATFDRELRRLLDASRAWTAEVVGRVASRVFSPR